jgi:hypothetical protein
MKVGGILETALPVTDPAASAAFEPASRWGLSDEYGGGEAFRVIVWVGVPPPGVVEYAPELGMFG